jgi:hypothetical protein
LLFVARASVAYKRELQALTVSQKYCQLSVRSASHCLPIVEPLLRQAGCLTSQNLQEGPLIFGLVAEMRGSESPPDTRAALDTSGVASQLGPFAVKQPMTALDIPSPDCLTPGSEAPGVFLSCLLVLLASQPVGTTASSVIMHVCLVLGRAR